MEPMTKPMHLLFGGFLLVVSGCRKETSPASEAAPAPSASVADLRSATPKAPLPKGSTVPLPPRFVVLPGEGIAAIRFGATPETVKRHVGVPCDVETETRCVFVDRALDFHFEGGVLTKIRIERFGRGVPGVPGRFFGTFNGAMAPKIMLGLHRHVVASEWPEKPERVEPLSGTDGQVERQTFRGLALEFDQLENGNTVLAAFEVTKAESTKAP